MKRSIYKIMGATGLIALLLIGGIVSAAPAQQQPEQEQELELQSEPADPPEQPNDAYLFADLVSLECEIDYTITGRKLAVDVANIGSRPVLFRFWHLRIEVIKPLQENPVFYKKIFGTPWPGVTNAKRYKVDIPATLIGTYTCVVEVDYFNSIWEGFIGGEFNNKDSYLVSFILP
jgi:hypothetical protein